MKSTIFAAALMGACTLFGETILKLDQPSDFLQKTITKTADGLSVKTRHGSFLAKKTIRIDSKAKYRISVDVRCPAAKIGYLYLTLIPMNNRSRVITPGSINARKNTETTLAAAVKKGDKVLKLKDAKAWINKTTHGAIVFNAKDDFSDLPNFSDLNIKKGSIRKVGNVWELELVKPVTRAYPAGCKVRQHFYGGTYIYPKIVRNLNNKEWTTFSGEISGIAKNVRMDSKFWPGTVTVRPMLLLTGGTPDSVLEFRNFKLEIVK